MTDISTSLNPPQLVIDDYQQLVVDALLHTYTASEGAFTEFQTADFTPPFIAAFAYAGSELLYKANLASEAAAKSFLANVLGVTEDLGAKATTTIQFKLSASLSSDFIIPAGFEVTTPAIGGNPLRFYTETTLTIPAGLDTGTVTAIAENIGDEYNVSAGFIDQITSPLTYLQSAINIEPSVNGRDAEAVENLIERSAQVLRLRNPTSALDFEQLAQILMGEGSRAKCIGKLGRDKDLETPQLGVIHLFLLDKNGDPANLATQALVGNAISPRLSIGTNLLVSPLEILEVSVSLIAKSYNDRPTDLLANQIYTALKNYLSYKTFPIGEPVLIEEVKYAIRNVGGFTISYLLLNEQPLNVAIPNPWTQAQLSFLNVQIVDNPGVVIYNNTFFEESPEVE